MATIAQALARASELEGLSDTPRLDTEVLLAETLKQDKTYLYTWPERELSAEQYHTFMRLLQRRAEGIPVAHILGFKEFWSLSLEVSGETLIPRPETELLVELALQLFEKESERRVADLGTGTGAIALAIATERPAWQLWAIDCVVQAVKLAERNRERLGVDNLVCVVSDWLEGVPIRDFDLIVSNPPYINAGDPHLNQGDVRFEPESALVAGNDGLADIDVIARQARQKLKTGGYLLLEHGWQQRDRVMQLLDEQGYRNLVSHRDLAGQDRAVLCQWPG